MDRHSPPLAAIVRWPTPNARDGTGAPGANYEAASLPRDVKDLEGSGSLNPTWVEWLMGFPAGWTDLDALATP